MLYSTDWYDFVIYPQRPELGDSLKNRLNIDKAYRKLEDGSMPLDFNPKSEKGIVIQKSDIECSNDKFQAILINDFGNVCIWTDTRIWITTRIGKSGAIEKIQYYPTNYNEV